ncbi:MAG: hypothetical protein QOH69_2426 [Actinomycetota bacterium]|nr:hypothetical protein [Actinomycetota bacterium]
MTSYNAALAEAFREHRDVLYRIAVARLRGAGLQGDAQDVVSTAVLSLMDHPVAAVTNWRALLIDVVEKKVVDHLRSAWSRRRDGREPKPDDVKDDRFDIADAEDEIDVLKAIQVATDALNALPEPHQTIARECLWHERKQNEVATALGISQPRVSQVLKEAKNMIASKIEESGVTR